MAYVDRGFGLKQLNGDSQLQIRLFKKFHKEYITLEDDLRQCIQSGNYSRAHGYVHTLKGVCANLGCHTLFRLSDLLQTQLLSEQVEAETLKSFIDALDGTLKEINRLVCA
ncbi:Hpt domain-containing protein [Alteromonas aestuariivivens]|nr:Hpt domain-containing protein [Alteromonas aestuariivivens]